MPKFFKQNLLTPEHLLEPPHIQNEGFQSEMEQNLNYIPDTIKTLFSWTAPSRPFRKKDRSFYTTVLILVVLTSLIAFIAGEKLLIGAILALMFMVYVLNFVPPEEIKYKISTQGVTVGDHFYHYEELGDFWLEEKNNHKILHIQTVYRFPAVLMLVLKNVNDEDIKKTVAKYLPFREIVQKTLIEHWADILQKHFPLENPQS